MISRKYEMITDSSFSYHKQTFYNDKWEQLL